MVNKSIITKIMPIIIFLLGSAPFQGIAIAATANDAKPISPQPDTIYSNISRILSIPYRDAKSLVIYVQKMATGGEISAKLIKEKNRALKRTVVPAATALVLIGGALGIKFYRNSVRNAAIAKVEEDKKKAADEEKRFEKERIDNLWKEDPVGQFSIAIQKKDPNAVQNLINANAINAKDKYGDSPLMVAFMEKDKETAEKLIQAGADVNAKDKDNNSVLHYAIHTGMKEDPDFITMLFTHGAKPSDIKPSDIYAVIFQKDLGKFNALIKAGVNMDASGYSPLHLATYAEAKDLLQAIINTKVNINPQSIQEDNATPLHQAVSRKNPNLEIIQILIDAGANPNLQDAKGKTPLDIAKQSKNQQIIDILEKK